MKKILVTLAVGLVLTSCNSSDDKNGTDKKETDKEKTGGDLTSNPDYQKGLTLIANNDCLTCHKVDEVHTGPSYKEVAKKYANAPDTIVAHLARTIIDGSKGVWGEAFMTPHAGLSQQDAEQMVKYILLLKN